MPVKTRTVRSLFSFQARPEAQAQIATPNSRSKKKRPIEAAFLCRFGLGAGYGSYSAATKMCSGRGDTSGNAQATVAAAQAAQARVRLAVAGFEVGVALDAHIHLRTGHHRFHAGFGVRACCCVLSLCLAQFGACCCSRLRRSGRGYGLGIGAACGHGGLQEGRAPRSTRSMYCPRLRGLSQQNSIRTDPGSAPKTAGAAGEAAFACCCQCKPEGAMTYFRLL